MLLVAHVSPKSLQERDDSELEDEGRRYGYAKKSEGAKPPAWFPRHKKKMRKGTLWQAHSTRLFLFVQTEQPPLEIERQRPILGALIATREKAGKTSKTPDPSLPNMRYTRMVPALLCLRNSM